MGFSSESYTIMTMCRQQKNNSNYMVDFKFSDSIFCGQIRLQKPKIPVYLCIFPLPIQLTGLEVENKAIQ